MKFFYSAAVLVAIVLTLAGCKSTPAKMVVGTWKIGEMDPGIEIPAEQLAKFEEMMKSVKESSTMEVKEDGTFIETMITNKLMESSGTWSLSEDGLTFVRTEDETQITDSLQVVELSDNKFVVAAEDRGRRMVITYIK
ncbi:MAG: lipocalin family protein [Flavobacteriales bacterium]|nr:lipocalin family protein [Flavobacteriales bacterium]